MKKFEILVGNIYIRRDKTHRVLYCEVKKLTSDYVYYDKYNHISEFDSADSVLKSEFYNLYTISANINNGFVSLSDI